MLTDQKNIPCSRICIKYGSENQLIQQNSNTSIIVRHGAYRDIGNLLVNMVNTIPSCFDMNDHLAVKVNDRLKSVRHELNKVLRVLPHVLHVEGHTERQVDSNKEWEINVRKAQSVHERIIHCVGKGRLAYAGQIVDERLTIDLHLDVPVWILERFTNHKRGDTEEGEIGLHRKGK